MAGGLNWGDEKIEAVEEEDDDVDKVAFEEIGDMKEGTVVSFRGTSKTGEKAEEGTEAETERAAEAA